MPRLTHAAIKRKYTPKPGRHFDDPPDRSTLRNHIVPRDVVYLVRRRRDAGDYRDAPPLGCRVYRLPDGTPVADFTCSAA